MDGQTRMITAGVHDLDAATYHQDPCPEPSLSSSLARLILDQSPLHAWTASPRLNPAWEPVESATFDIGRAAHRAVLGKGADYVAYPADLLAANGAASTKDAKAWAEEQRAEGRTPLKADDLERVDAMAQKALATLPSYGIHLDPLRSELTAVAQIDDVWCRAMIDNAPTDPRAPLMDFKTCVDASPEACRRAVENYGYDVQMAHYLDCWRAATDEHRDFLFIFQEKTDPFEIGVVRLLNSPGHSADWLEDARQKAAVARHTWRDCLRSGVWSGNPRMIIEVGATPYFRQRWQDTAARGAVANAKPSRDAMERARAWQSPEPH
jgi:hypothetical protein